ncbi:hypothetical protein MMC26_000905 [Xylographa opegraphella]|nr:hypothetical protein [Xylographa opegraphella]
MSQAKAVEGVFAIHKPPAITSAQVVRDLQKAFNPSELFAPWLANEKANRERENGYQKKRRRDKRLQVKIGHGGTLDPLATGVLIIGVGKGTKHLQNFLMCTKAYEATLLFGAATDTYDVQGKLLSKAPYSHITRTKVEEALDAFRGQIMQRPPIYSALRIQGKHLYEYAREGKELPVEIQERPVTVEKLEITEWLEPGSHEYKWPAEEALQEEKEVAEKVLHLSQDGTGASVEPSMDNQTLPIGTKRKRPPAYVEGDLIYDTDRAGKRQERDSDVVMSGGLLEATEDEPQTTSVKEEQTAETANQGSSTVKITITEEDTPPTTSAKPTSSEPKHSTQTTSPTTTGSPPAVKLRMTVTSGFYVRSLCHDLGKAVFSLGIMAELVRTRQGEFELGKNALEYEELGKGETVWGPQVRAMLEGWQAKVEQGGNVVVGGGKGEEVD